MLISDIAHVWNKSKADRFAHATRHSFACHVLNKHKMCSLQIK